jgi:uncharacterized protein YbjT (DUF2867 family)
MAENKKPLIAVLGATGNQGGSVVEHLLALNKFRIRGITRNSKGDAAKALAAKGVEVVEASTADKKALVAAFNGAWGVYSVTQFWDPEVMKNPELEFERGKTTVDAAVEAKVSLFVWSGLANSDGVSKKKWHVPHFTNKWRVEEYARSQKSLQCVFVYAGFYAQNFMTFFQPQKAEDGTVLFAMPLRADVGLPMFDVSDTGRVVAPIFADHKKHVGKVIPMAGEYITGPCIAQTFSCITGVKAKFVQVDLDAFKKLAGEELAHMYGWFNEYGYMGGMSLEAGHAIAPNQNTWASFLRKTGWNASGAKGINLEPPKQ